MPAARAFISIMENYLAAMAAAAPVIAALLEK
jgi:hypothetical protein